MEQVRRDGKGCDGLHVGHSVFARGIILHALNSLPPIDPPASQSGLSVRAAPRYAALCVRALSLSLPSTCLRATVIARRLSSTDTREATLKKVRRRYELGCSHERISVSPRVGISHAFARSPCFLLFSIERRYCSGNAALSQSTRACVRA